MENSRRGIIIGIYLILALVACNRGGVTSKNNLEIALEQSGNNRSELEKVLNHYSVNSKDTLKLKASKFLIENMIAHQSMCGKYIKNHIRWIDSLCPTMKLAIKMNLYTMPAKDDTLLPEIEFKKDIAEVKADFLIQNIEDSFQLWENSNYSPNVSFDNFCDYLLPYKLKQEPLILWKDPLTNKKYSGKINEFELSLEQYYKYVNDVNSTYSSLLRELPYKYDSEDNTYNKAYFMRSMGVPVAVDFMPFISDNCHWISVISHKYINNHKQVLGERPFNAPKIFRKTYSLNATPEESENVIPDFVGEKYNMDVTDFYYNVTSVKYDFGEIPKSVKYGYLSFFDNFSWVEIAWDKLKDGKATFSKMGRSVVYIPTYYDKNRKVNAKHPLSIDDMGRVSEIIPKKGIKCNLTLRRVFPGGLDGEVNGKKFIATSVLACNDIRTDSLDCVGSITHYKNMEFDTVNINSQKKYCTWIMKPYNYNNISIGDIQFFDEYDRLLQGKFFGIFMNKITTNDDITRLFDNNIFTSWGVNCDIGVIFKEPKAVKYIKYITSVDNGGIYPDNEYELFYFDNGEWVSLGRKVATGFSIDYKDAPSDALFWLHNHTSHVPERPFTIVNGKIKFW